MRASRVLVPFAAVLTLCAAPGRAQAPPSPLIPAQEEPTGVPDRFRIDLGGMRLSATTVLNLNAPTAASDVDFEQDLSLPGSGTRLWGDLYVRLARRHQFNVNYTRFGREGEATTAPRAFTWGDYVYTSGGAAQGTVKFSLLTGEYRFALLKSPKFELGPKIGAAYIKVTAKIVGEATKDGADAGLATVESETSQFGFDLGVFLAGWIGERVQVRGDLGYMKFSPEEQSASILGGRAGLTYFPWRKIGFGVAYKYDKFEYDRGLSQTLLGGQFSYHGIAAEASFAF